MPNEYNDQGLIILRDTSGTQMSLPRFFQLALVDGNGNYARPTSDRPGHYAWDMGTAGALTVPARTPVCGTVISASDGYNGGMGTHAVVQEDNGRQHRFMHFVESSLRVSVGDSVSQGDTLGLIGNTGESYGAHLHYDVMVNGTFLNRPIDAYDCTTLPAGWSFADSVASGGNWDYIPLDHAATDYGPPGGITPGTPFYPRTQCYDISWAQVVNGSLDLCIDAIASSGGGGIILQVGGITNAGFVPADSFNVGDAVRRIINRGLGIGVYFYNYADYAQDMTTAFQDGLAYLQTVGATKQNLNMGVWIDTEVGQRWDPVPDADTHVNYAYVEKFLNVFNNADYPLVGIYSSAGTFVIYPEADICDKPLWAAYVDFTFEQASRQTLNQYLPESVYTRVYIFQHSWICRVNGYSGDLDGDKVLMPLPTIGGGGGSYTEVIKVTVDVIPPKRIYFSPVPGIVVTESDLLSEREETITISTDADNATLYYTTDGSSPYQYTFDNGYQVFALAATAQQYVEPIVINKDTHIRVIAVPEGTTYESFFAEPLAKGSGTFLFQYRNLNQEWDAEQKSYATGDDNTSFFEENRQAFLLLHDQLTQEEVLYADVYRHNTQSAAEDAVDNASTVSGTEPNLEPMNGGEENVSNP